MSSGEEMMESRSRGHVRPPEDPSGERPPKEARVSKQEKKEETYEPTQESQKLQTGRPGSSTVAHDRSQFSVEEVRDSGAMARGHGTTAGEDAREAGEAIRRLSQCLAGASGEEAGGRPTCVLYGGG